MVRVANTGISALIDPFGRLSAQIPLGQEGFLDVALPEPRPITTYARFGNWPIVLILLSAGVLIGRKTHRHR